MQKNEEQLGRRARLREELIAPAIRRVRGALNLPLRRVQQDVLGRRMQLFETTIERGDYDIAWRAADAARLALLVQREAVGLRDQRVVDQQFPRPPRRP